MKFANYRRTLADCLLKLQQTGNTIEFVSFRFMFWYFCDNSSVARRGATTPTSIIMQNRENTTFLTLLRPTSALEWKTAPPPWVFPNLRGDRFFVWSSTELGRKNHFNLR